MVNACQSACVKEERFVHLQPGIEEVEDELFFLREFIAIIVLLEQGFESPIGLELRIERVGKTNS